jgi:hypothetical protein
MLPAENQYSDTVLMVEDVPILNRVTNNYTMDKHFLILQELLGVVATQ